VVLHEAENIFGVVSAGVSHGVNPFRELPHDSVCLIRCQREIKNGFAIQFLWDFIADLRV
jgi:hypothetical protein